MSMVELIDCNYQDNQDTIDTQKKIIVHNIKNLFEKNYNLACYSIFLTTYFFDSLFECYLQSYVGKVNLDDKDKIKDLIENTLDINLNEYMNEIELIEMYNYCKNYIIILIN